MEEVFGEKVEVRDLIAEAILQCKNLDKTTNHVLVMVRHGTPRKRPVRDTGGLDSVACDGCHRWLAFGVLNWGSRLGTVGPDRSMLRRL